ncbi:MAG: hypothetical protein ABSD56_13985, partial [Bryobacteraceae bacterium]
VDAVRPGDKDAVQADFRACHGRVASPVTVRDGHDMRELGIRSREREFPRSEEANEEIKDEIGSRVGAPHQLVDSVGLRLTGSQCGGAGVQRSHGLKDAVAVQVKKLSI